MNNNHALVSFRLLLLLILIVLISSCTPTLKGDEFTFHAPGGFKTEQFETQVTSSTTQEPQRLIFSRKGDVAFWVDRRKIPDGSDLEAVFELHQVQTSEISTGYQFISRKLLEHDRQGAIEYVYRLFSGEWYWQRREVWLENNGWAYSLVCSDPADSTPGIEIPVNELCIRLVEGFKFD